ncbi:MAG: paraquat-inducible protein A [Verrucomicrobiales bacterium]|nr:paraquat-inducible protein A [Verrucomicrobiales bacterium]
MRRIHLALIGLVFNLALLLPGILLPVMTVTGHLEPAGIAAMAPSLLDAGISDSAIKSFKPMLNPLVTGMLGSDAKLKEELLKKLTPQIVESLTASGDRIEVYYRSRSILGTVQYLYQVDSPLAASLILIFSVVVPFGKVVLVLWTYFQTRIGPRKRGARILALIKKWSMADVFAVALFIAYLSAKATQEPAVPGGDPNLVTFNATFGAGFYWFLAYCLVSIATHHVTVKAADHATMQTKDPA